VLPLAASAGVRVRKLSGASLSHCRGTIDKLSALPGFRHVDCLDVMTDEVERFGFSIGRTSSGFCAGDTLTYNMRNLVGATEVPDLIAASIMSKKLALRPKGLVLDVKLGRGGLFASRDIARQTAMVMIEIAEDFGLPARAYLTEMEHPLGSAIGGLSEVEEAVHLLTGTASDPVLLDLAVELAAGLASMENGLTRTEAVARVRDGWDSGDAGKRFLDWLLHRGADLSFLEHDPADCVEIVAPRAGWITDMDARQIGALSSGLASASGRGDIRLARRVGCPVDRGDVIARMVAPASLAERAVFSFIRAVQIKGAPATPRPMITDRIQTRGLTAETTLCLQIS
jgi:thymidine phosphorylase